MDPRDDHAEALQPQSRQPRQQDSREDRHPYQINAGIEEQSEAPQSAAQEPHRVIDEALAAFTGPVGAELSGAGLHEDAQDQQPVHDSHTTAPPHQPAAHEDAAQAPQEGSYEALAAFTGPVAAEMTGAGLHDDAQGQQPTHEQGKLPHNHYHQRDPSHATAHPAQADQSEVELEAMQADAVHQGQSTASQQDMSAPAAEFSAHSTATTLPFHPEQSLQQAQEAADIKLMHDADEAAGAMQDMRPEKPDQEMTDAPQMHEHSGLDPAGHEAFTRQAIARAQQERHQQTGQPQSVPAVRTLDDIMSQFESPAVPHVQSLRPSVAPQIQPQPDAGTAHQSTHSPKQAQRYQPGSSGHAEHDGQTQTAHASQDQHMTDLQQADMPPKTPIEMPDGGLLQSKGSAKGGPARRQEIKPETDSGSVVWAKTKGYPWWPAQVLAIDDPWIPPDMEIPRRGAVPVRFFGTYNFTWIESQRNLMPFDLGCQDDLPTKGNTKVFQDGLAEAQKYLDMGETPPGFAVMPASPDAGPEEGPAKASKRSGSAKTRDGGPVGPGISKDAGKVAAARRKEAEKAAAAKAAALQRRQRALRKLGLVPPRGSQYAEEPCLDIARTWFAQALVEEQTRQVRVAEQQRQMEERQKLQQAMFQRQIAAQMLHQQQLLQRAAMQQAQQSQQEEEPRVWQPNQAFASAAQQEQQQQVAKQYQAQEQDQQ